MMWSDVSSYAIQFDKLALFLLAVGLFFTIAIFAVMVFFCIRYHRIGEDQRGSGPIGKFWLEVTWGLVPFLIMFGIFIWGANLYMELFTTEKFQNNVSVMAKQWMWKFYYSHGKEEVNTLYLPVNETSQLMMISEDVIHSFYLPDFRIKKDVLPGRYIRLYVHPIKIGTYPIRCAEYCGTNHSKMTGKIKVLSQKDFDSWIGSEPKAAEALSLASGRKIFEEHQCSSCHKEQDTSLAPDLYQSFGKTIPLADGHQILMDEDYIRKSITDPQAQIHQGYPAAMPTFQGQLSEEELLSLVSYIKFLSKREDL